MSAFRSASPLLAVTLVNKVTSLSMAVLPVLVVALRLPAGEAALVVGLAKGAAVIGTLSSGPLADRFGARNVLLASIVIAGAGSFGMAAATSSVTLGAAACVAQAGLACFPVLNRLVIAGLVPLEQQRESLAWLRTTANLGLVVSFALGGLFGTHLAALLAADGALAFVAAGLGLFLLPAIHGTRGGAAGRGTTWGPFLWATAVVCGWGFAYEGYLTAAAALLRSDLGPRGAAVFSQLMVLNTVGCTLLGVVFASRISSPDRTVLIGSVLLCLGTAIGVSGSLPAAFAGMALATLGELVFSATAQFAWMSLVPDSPRKSTHFAMAMTASFAARALGGALVFPLVVEGAHPSLAMAAICVPLLVAASFASPAWRAFRELGGVR